MFFGTQVKHKKMNLNVLTWFALLPFGTISAVMSGKNLQRICRHSARCRKTCLKSGSTIDMFITVMVLVGMWTNNIHNKCSEAGELCNF